MSADDKTEIERLLKSLENAELAREREARALDLSAVTLSAGALTLSLTFIEKVSPNPVGVWWLYTSWGFFILCIISYKIAGIATSFVVWPKYIQMIHMALDNYRILPENRRFSDEEYAVRVGKCRKQMRVASTTSQFFNFLCYASLVLAFGFIAMFSFTNMQNRIEKEREKNEHGSQGQSASRGIM